MSRKKAFIVKSLVFSLCFNGQTFLISRGFFLLQINKALNFEVNRRYHNTIFEPQAIQYSYQKNQKRGKEVEVGKWQHHCFLRFLLHGHRTKILPNFVSKKSENSTIDITTYVCALD